MKNYKWILLIIGLIFVLGCELKKKHDDQLEFNVYCIDIENDKVRKENSYSNKQFFVLPNGYDNTEKILFRENEYKSIMIYEYEHYNPLSWIHYPDILAYGVWNLDGISHNRETVLLRDNNSLYMMNCDGGAYKNILEDKNSEKLYPEFSYDDTKVIYIDRKNEDGTYYESINVCDLTTNNIFVYNRVNTSNDGVSFGKVVLVENMIYFLKDSENEKEIGLFSYNIENSEEKMLINDKFYDFSYNGKYACLLLNGENLSKYDLESGTLSILSEKYNDVKTIGTMSYDENCYVNSTGTITYLYSFINNSFIEYEDCSLDSICIDSKNKYILGIQIEK